MRRGNIRTYTLDELRQVKGIGEKTIQRIVKQFNDGDYVSEYNPDIHIDPNTLVHGDMLEVMNGIPDKSVDMILTDLPYGVTAMKWDIPIPFERMWEQYCRVLKDDGNVVLFGAEPFSTRLRASNLEWYRYDWVWIKHQGVDPLMARFRPMNNIENIMVFNKGGSKYNPQFWFSTPYINRRDKKGRVQSTTGVAMTETITRSSDGRRYPLRTLYYKNVQGGHPSQKPTPLLEYLIKTYTNENDVVLDSTMGSGSTCVASVNTNRKYIGIELDEEYYNIAVSRVEEAKSVIVR